MHRPHILRIHAKSNRPRARIADSSSTKRSQLSSARTTKRFPSSRCPSTIQIARIPGGNCTNAIGYAEHRSRSHDAVICVYDDADNVIETHEHKGDFKEPYK